MSISSLADALCSLSVGHLLKKFTTPTIIIFGFFITILGIIGYSYYTNSWIQLIIWTIPLGMGTGFITTSINNYAAHHYTSLQMNWLHGF